DVGQTQRARKHQSDAVTVTLLSQSFELGDVQPIQQAVPILAPGIDEEVRRLYTDREAANRVHGWSVRSVSVRVGGGYQSASVRQIGSEGNETLLPIVAVRFAGEAHFHEPRQATKGFQLLEQRGRLLCLRELPQGGGHLPPRWCLCQDLVKN